MSRTFLNVFFRQHMIHVSRGSSINCYTDFCYYADENLLQIFWDCPKIHNYGLGVQSWTHANSTHCDNLTLTKELIILGSKINIVKERISDSFTLMARHHIITAKIQGTTLYKNTLIMKITSRFSAEIYYYTVNNLSSMFTSKWMLFLFFISHDHIIF